MSFVLLITPDADTEALAQRALVTGGHKVITAESCDAALRSQSKARIDAVVFDSAAGESELQGLFNGLQTGDGNYPLVFLTSANSGARVDSLPITPSRSEIVIKPCEGRDIRDAVDRTIGSTHRTGPDALTIGDVRLDRDSHELRGDGTSVQLTRTEFRLMHYLAQRRGNVVSADELLEKVWEFYPGTGSSELVRSHVRNLRGKLLGATGRKDLVQTVPRRGYRLA
jgi:two-component system OmpR family response regulator